jgi:hypothetical protein
LPRDTAEVEAKGARLADKSEGFAEPPPAAAARRKAEPNAPAESSPFAFDQALGTQASGTSERAAGAGLAAPAATAGAKDAYASAMELYEAGRYVESEKAFRAVAASGSRNAPLAALYAAKSAEAAFGCGKAAPMYEAAASRYGATTPGAEALWAAANCYKAIGSLDKAAVFYNELRKVAGYRDRAEGELASLRLQQGRVAARKAAPAQALPPSPPPASPVPAAAEPPAAERRAP